MNGYNVSERVRRVLASAHEHSHRLGHEYVDTEHILLGLLDERDGVATAAPTNLGVDLEALKHRIETAIGPAKADRSPDKDLPYTSRAKEVLELSIQQGLDLHHTYVGTEHLLLGLIREETGIAAQMLLREGATLDFVLAETTRLVGPPTGSR